MKKTIMIIFLLCMSWELFSETNPNAKKYHDQDGDDVDVIDYNVRQKLRDIETEMLNKKDFKNAFYIVKVGDTLKSISEKLYGSAERTDVLWHLNLGILKGKDVVPGMKLKYLKP